MNVLSVPVPFEKSEFVILVLFAVLSLRAEEVITMLFAVVSIILELLISVSQINPFENLELVISTSSKSVLVISELDMNVSNRNVLPEITVSVIVPFEKSVVTIVLFEMRASSRISSSIEILVRIRPFAVP